MSKSWQSFFYNTDGLSLEQKKKLLQDAYKKCTSYSIEELNCSISCARKKVDTDFDTILEKLSSRCHYVVIERNDIKQYGEIGFSTLSINGINYFLFINVDMTVLKEIIEKYNLKLLWS